MLSPTTALALHPPRLRFALAAERHGQLLGPQFVVAVVGIIGKAVAAPPTARFGRPFSRRAMPTTSRSCARSLGWSGRSGISSASRSSSSMSPRSAASPTRRCRSASTRGASLLPPRSWRRVSRRPGRQLEELEHRAVTPGVLELVRIEGGLQCPDRLQRLLVADGRPRKRIGKVPDGTGVEGWRGALGPEQDGGLVGEGMPQPELVEDVRVLGDGVHHHDVGVAEPLDHADMDDARVQAAVLPLPGQVGVLQDRHDHLVEGGVAVHLAALVPLLAERHGHERPRHLGLADARVDVDHGEVVHAGDGTKSSVMLGSRHAGAWPHGQGEHAVVAVFRFGHLLGVLDQRPVPGPIAGVVRRLVVLDDLASGAALHQGEHPVVPLAPGITAVGDRRLPELAGPERQHDVDVDPFDGQRLLEQQQVGPSGRGAHHHPWPQRAQEACPAAPHERHLRLGKPG